MPNPLIRLSVEQAFTRPADATAYTAGDLVANNVTAGSVVPLNIPVPAMLRSSGAVINSAVLKKSANGFTNAAFRLHFFSVSPVVAGGDNAAMDVGPQADNWLGALEGIMIVRGSGGSLGRLVPIPLVTATMISWGDIIIPPGLTNIFGLIEARAAYTPTSAEVFTLKDLLITNLD